MTPRRRTGELPPSVVARESRPRELTDPKTMRALAHPVRLALLEALGREGPLTATQAATLLGDTPGNMSWHLQTLARYGFVEEAGGAKGRARPWRLVALGSRFSTGSGDPVLERAQHDLAATTYERAFDQIRQWTAERYTYPAEWQRSAFWTNSLAYLTPTELDRLGADMLGLIDRYRERLLDRGKRPAEAAPVHVVAVGHALPPTASGN